MTAAFEKCAQCGGVLGTFRVIIDGETFHPRCSHDARDHRIAALEAALREVVNQVRVADDPEHMTLALVGKIAAHALQAK